MQSYPAVVLSGMQHSPDMLRGHWKVVTAVTAAARASVRILEVCIVVISDLGVETVEGLI